MDSSSSSLTIDLPQADELTDRVVEEAARAAVPLSTETLRRPSGELAIWLKDIGYSLDQRDHALLGKVADWLESQSPPSPAGWDGRARSEAAVKAASEVIERMESRHPEDVIARAALSAAEAADPSVPLREINGETPICGDCVTIGKPSCDVQGHGITQLAELVDSYSNSSPPSPAVGLTVGGLTWRNDDERRKAAFAAFRKAIERGNSEQVALQEALDAYGPGDAGLLAVLADPDDDLVNAIQVETGIAGATIRQEILPLVGRWLSPHRGTESEGAR